MPDIREGVILEFSTKGLQSVDEASRKLGQFEKTTGDTSKKLDTFTASTGRATGGAKSMGGGMDALTGIVSRFAGPLAVGAAIVALGNLAKKFLDTADEAGKLAKRTGFSTEFISVMSYQAQLADGSLSGLRDAFRAFSRQADEALQGNTEIGKSFERLGISVEELATLAPDDLFKRTAQAITDIEDPLTRGALAQQVLGRGAQELMPLLQDMADGGFARAADEAERFGVVLSGDAVAAAEQFNDNLVRVKTALTGVSHTFMNAMLPALTSFSDAMVKAFGSDFFQAVVLTGLDLMAKALKGVAALVMIAVGAVKLFAETTMNAFGAAGDAATAVIEGRWGEIPGIMARLTKENSSSIEQIVSDTLAQLDRLFFGGNGGVVAKTEQRTAREIVNAANVIEGQLDDATKAWNAAAIKYDAAVLKSIDDAMAAREKLKKEMAEWVEKHRIAGDVSENMLNLDKLRASGAQAAKAIVEGVVNPLVVAAVDSTIYGIGRGLSTLFRDVAGGGDLKSAIDGFATSITDQLGSVFDEWLNGWMQSLAEKARGKIDPVTGQATGGSRSAQFGLAGVQSIATVYSLYQQGQAGASKGDTALSGAISGAAIGTQIAPGVGTAIGAILGGIVGYFMGSEAKKQFARIIVTGENIEGRATGFKDMSAEDAAQYAERAGKAARSYWNAYNSILMKIPGEFARQFKGTLPSTIGDWTKDFARDFELWISGRLPRTIAGMFKDAIGKGLESVYGLTAERFDELWAFTSTMDPKDAAVFFGHLIDGLNSLRDATMSMDSIRTLAATGTGRFDPSSGGILTGSKMNPFMAALEESARNIFDIAREVVNLTGDEQVQAFAKLGASIKDVTKALGVYIQDIIDAKKRLEDDFRAARLNKLLDREEDPNKQARLLEAEYDRIMGMIANAGTLGLTPQEVEALTRQGLSLLDQIYNLDPSEAAYEWWLRQVEILEKMSLDALDALGAAAIAAVDRLIAQMQPFVDWFMGIPVDIDAALALVYDGFEGFATALDDLINKINNFDPYDPRNGGGDPVPRGGGVGPGGPVGPGRTPGMNVTVSIPINAPVYGVEDLHETITRTVDYATRRAMEGYN